MKKMSELKMEEEIAAFLEKAKRMHGTKLQESVISLVFELNEAKEQIEAGEYISIDEAFDRVIAKYEE